MVDSGGGKCNYLVQELVFSNDWIHFCLHNLFHSCMFIYSVSSWKKQQHDNLGPTNRYFVLSWPQKSNAPCCPGGGRIWNWQTQSIFLLILPKKLIILFIPAPCINTSHRKLAGMFCLPTEQQRCNLHVMFGWHFSEIFCLLFFLFKLLKFLWKLNEFQVTNQWIIDSTGANRTISKVVTVILP